MGFWKELPEEKARYSGGLTSEQLKAAGESENAVDMAKHVKSYHDSRGDLKKKMAKMYRLAVEAHEHAKHGRHAEAMRAHDEADAMHTVSGERMLDRDDDLGMDHIRASDAHRAASLAHEKLIR
jgi:hypothetical protein